MRGERAVVQRTTIVTGARAEPLLARRGEIARRSSGVLKGFYGVKAREFAACLQEKVVRTQQIPLERPHWRRGAVHRLRGRVRLHLRAGGGWVCAPYQTDPGKLRLACSGKACATRAKALPKPPPPTLRSQGAPADPRISALLSVRRQRPRKTQNLAELLRAPRAGTKNPEPRAPISWAGIRRGNPQIQFGGSGLAMDAAG